MNTSTATRTTDVDLPDALGLKAYVARPTTPGAWPGVVLLHEMFGVDQSIRNLADQLAEAGFLTVAPDLLGRLVGPGFVDVVRSILGAGGSAAETVVAAGSWLREQDGCTGAVGVVGASMGASLALRCLAEFDAASLCYPVQLFSLASVLDDEVCPVQVQLGGTDPTAIGAVERFEEALAGSASAYEVISHSGAGHSYLNTTLGLQPLRPVLRLTRQGPREDVAAATVERTVSFLRDHLVASG